ncbi:MAG TPA: hypothetical protein VLX92_09540 [Kofleriaceae bacterium]|nr:hypothetical protein [Kofleriaceae bacterium]
MISSGADSDLELVRDTVAHKAVVGGRCDLESLFCDLLAAARPEERPKTLDLIGHAAPGYSLLTLGSWVVDATNKVVSSYFRELAENKVLPRLGIHAVRLLGSLTADSMLGQATICALSDILDVEVYGTRNLLHAEHFIENGFDDRQDHLLANSSDLRREPPSSQPLLLGRRVMRALDLDALPATTLAAMRATAWPRRFASRLQAGMMLGMVRRDAGWAMPGLLAAPSCEVAIPADAPGRYHVVQVMLEGTFLRVERDASSQGDCYKVSDPRALLELVETLPQSVLS